MQQQFAVLPESPFKREVKTLIEVIDEHIKEWIDAHNETVSIFDEEGDNPSEETR